MHTRSDTVDTDVDVLMTQIIGQLPGYMHSSSLAHLVVVSFIPSAIWNFYFNLHCTLTENPRTCEILVISFFNR